MPKRDHLLTLPCSRVTSAKTSYIITSKDATTAHRAAMADSRVEVVTSPSGVSKKRASLPVKIARLFKTFLHAIWATNCASCQKPLRDDAVPFFCDACWSHIHPVPAPTCGRCGRPFPSPVALLRSPRHACSSCRLRPPSFTRAWTIYSYEPPLKEAITLFKYRGKIALAGHLGNLISRAAPALPPIDMILPVPLHPSRLRKREYNQSHVLAAQLSRRLSVPVSHANLRRVRPTTPQTMLRKKDRLKNLRSAFVVAQPRAIAGKDLLLVDDVYTTGTTVNECAKALRKSGSGQVYVVTLARMV